MENKFFNRALSCFIHDVASGSAIRHLADSGLTVARIAKELSYPVSEEEIGKTVWAHYVETGIIFLEKPPEEPVIKKITYDKEYGKYGRTYFRARTEWIENPVKKYFPCDFGKRRYQNEEEFFRSLDKLWKSDREYILGLPWPLHAARTS